MRGDLDLGIVGGDMFAEIAADSPDLIVLHDALDFGHCHLGLGVPTSGRFSDVNSLQVRGCVCSVLTHCSNTLQRGVGRLRVHGAAADAFSFQQPLRDGCS